MFLCWLFSCFINRTRDFSPARNQSNFKFGRHLKIINSGDLLLEDDHSSSPSFLQKGTVTFSGGGQAEVEQYLTKDGWHMVASPVDGATISAYMWMYLYQYIEATEAFQYLTYPTSTPINVGQGYFVWPYTDDPIWNFPALT